MNWTGQPTLFRFKKNNVCPYYSRLVRVVGLLTIKYFVVVVLKLWNRKYNSLNVKRYLLYDLHFRVGKCRKLILQRQVEIEFAKRKISSKRCGRRHPSGQPFKGEYWTYNIAGLHAMDCTSHSYAKANTLSPFCLTKDLSVMVSVFRFQVPIPATHFSNNHT